MTLKEKEGKRLVVGKDPDLEIMIDNTELRTADYYSRSRPSFIYDLKENYMREDHVLKYHFFG